MTDKKVRWAEWFELQRSATQVWFDGSLAQAIEMLDEFVASEPPQAIKRQAIGYRGSLHNEAGDLHLAKADYLAAWELSEEQDFERYTLEESSAAISERLGRSAEAEWWCRKALQTAAADPKTSGSGCLLRLLKLRGRKGLSDEEHHLAKKVVYQAWHLLRVEGQPDLTDLEATCRKLIEAQRGPFSAERPPTPKAYHGPAEEG